MKTLTTFLGLILFMSIVVYLSPSPQPAMSMRYQFSPRTSAGWTGTMHRGSVGISKMSKQPYGKLPLSFEINRGQSDAQVKFVSHSQGDSLFLTRTEMILALRRAHFSPLAQSDSGLTCGWHSRKVVACAPADETATSKP